MGEVSRQLLLKGRKEIDNSLMGTEFMFRARMFFVFLLTRVTRTGKTPGHGKENLLVLFILNTE